MTHLSAEDLVLHYYDEGPAEAGEHLAGCEHCRAGYRELQRVLNAADGYAPPERPPDYEGRLWARIERELPARARGAGRWLPSRSVLAACGLSAVMVAAFFVGRWSAVPGPDPRPGPLLLNALEMHVDRSQLVLTEVANGSVVRKDDLADLLGANRLYRQTAEMSGEGAVADVLDELERLLMEAEHEQPDSGDEMRRRIETDGMLFKLRVLGDELRRKTETEFTEETL